MLTHIAVIPARGGSKGLPRKNALPIHGLPTIAYTIRAARQSDVFDRIIVTSDDDELLSIAEEEGATPLRESAEMAGDFVSSTVPVIWALEELDLDAEYVWNLQPTSPLRTPSDIVDASRIIAAHPDAKFLASVTPIDPHYFHWALRVEDEQARLWFPDFLVDRSLLPPVFRPNGAIKVGRPAALRASGSVFAPGLVTSSIDDHRSIHIRSEWDRTLAGFVISNFPEEFAWAGVTDG